MLGLKGRMALALRAFLAATVPLHLGAGMAVMPGLSPAAMAQDRAMPYVSRALEAVLLPIDAGVRAQFHLQPKAQGVLVISVRPEGMAAKAGIHPGDVISTVEGYVITSPVDLDAVVYYWMSDEFTEFAFGGSINGADAVAWVDITAAAFNAGIDTATIADWQGYEAEGFSYAAFFTDYSEEISESYQSAETEITQTAESEEFASSVSEAAEDAEASGDWGGVAEGMNPGDDGAEDDSAGGDGDADYSDNAGSEGEDAGADDAGAEDGGSEDGGSDDDGAVDDSGDDGGDDGSL